MESTIDRIYKTIDYKKDSIYKLSKDIGVSNGYFSKQRQSNGAISSNIIEKIVNYYPDIDANWLLTGRGEMLKEEKMNQVTKIHKPSKYMEKIIESQEIPLYDIRAAANLKTLFSQKDQNILSKITLPDIPRCDGAMYVTGDSMDPMIKSGDIICYKEIHDLQNIFYGEMYIISMDVEGDEYLTLKYIVHSDRGDDWVRLESYNKRHSPKDFELKNINALALVKISIRMNTM